MPSVVKVWSLSHWRVREFPKLNLETAVTQSGKIASPPIKKREKALVYTLIHHSLGVCASLGFLTCETNLIIPYLPCLRAEPMICGYPGRKQLTLLNCFVKSCHEMYLCT